MERHRCKLCFRHFANGRALGGHMRSHVMNDYQLKKGSKVEEYDEELEQEQLFDENLEQDYEDFQSVHSYSSTSEDDDEDEDEDDDDDDEDPKENPGLMDPEYSVSVVLQDRESETESSKKNPVSRRSKRVRNPRVSDFCMNGLFEVKKSKFGNEEQSKIDEKMETEPLSSISETTTEEDVAHCLIMMSKDKWNREEIEYEHEEEEEDDEKVGDDYSEDSGVEKVMIKSSSSSSKVRGKYRCETCNKLFRSYQALGGHRASHKKIKVNTATTPPSQKAVVGGGSKAAAVEEKIHECPFCHRVFASGQALGGHKRSHFIGAGAISTNINTSSPVKEVSRTSSPVKEVARVGETLNIDLNLPAPIDDEDEISHIANSAVSDAEFRMPH